MEKIDWDKAPEGATHYVKGSVCPFEKRDGDEWSYWNEQSRRWMKIHNLRGDERIEKSQMRMIERPSPAWSGEGLPPAGLVCELRNSPGGWGRAKITHQGKGITVWLWDNENPDQVEFAQIPERLEFRPTRTPEQIAADEREAAIEEILRVMDRGIGHGLIDPADIARNIYNAGYRKKDAN